MDANLPVTEPVLTLAEATHRRGAAADGPVGRGAILGSAHCGRMDTSAAALLRDGPAWVIAGGAATIAATIGRSPRESRSRRLRLLYGEALLILGEDDLALAELTALADEIGERLPAGLAWRLGAVHYLRADPHTAAATFARGRDADSPATADDAMLLAWDATARWMVGDLTACGDLARTALAWADAVDDDRARAAAYVALSLHAMLGGDRAGNAALQKQALRYAEAAGDVVQAARIRVNSASRLLEEAQYAQALIEARQAKELAEATGYASILAVARCNEAEALFRLGRLDEAADGYQQALIVFQLKSSHKVAYPLIGLGAIHQARGRHSLARASYEEAVRAAGATGDLQGLVPALSGLARVLAAIDPVGAAEQAELARQAASGPFVVEALLATGWAGLGGGDRGLAANCASDAADQARLHRDIRGLAEALELRAASLPIGAPTAETRRVLLEAAETWRLTGAGMDVDRVVAALGALPDVSIAERVAARLARDRLESAGVVLPAGVRVTHQTGVSVPRVVIRSLGRFEASVNGTAVTMSMWQSRKARDLLRVLVARRGRATAREELTQLLWPGGEPDRLAHRLSVALSTVRSVLDPDRVADQDYFVLADHTGVGLEVDHLSIDLELFLGEANHGFALEDRGRHGDARAALAAAERQYTGDFLANDPYEDWSVAAREEARTTYLRTVRTLAELNRSADRVDDAVHYLLKVIDKDPYDEAGHQELVRVLAASGRHGEARRARVRYLAAMREIGVEPSL